MVHTLDLIRYTSRMLQIGAQPRARSIHRRICVRCGCDGRAIERAAAAGTGEAWCPNCGCDLLRRPPRSYAEMEGLVIASAGLGEPMLPPGGPVPAVPLPNAAEKARQAFLHRFEKCLAVLFIMAVGFVAVTHFVYLGLTALD